MHGRETIYLDLDDDERFGGYSTGHPDTAVSPKRSTTAQTHQLRPNQKNERYFRILGTIRFGREALLASRTGYMAAIEVSKEGVCGNIVALWNAVPMHKHDYIEIEDDEWDTVVERHEKLRPCGLANSDLSGQLLVLADSVDGIGQALQVRNIVSNDLCATRAKLYGMDVAHVSFLS